MYIFIYIYIYTYTPHIFLPLDDARDGASSIVVELMLLG